MLHSERLLKTILWLNFSTFISCYAKYRSALLKDAVQAMMIREHVDKPRRNSYL